MNRIRLADKTCLENKIVEMARSARCGEALSQGEGGAKLNASLPYWRRAMSRKKEALRLKHERGQKRVSSQAQRKEEKGQATIDLVGTALENQLPQDTRCRVTPPSVDQRGIRRQCF